MGAEGTTGPDTKRQDADFPEGVSGFRGKAGSPLGQAGAWEPGGSEREEAAGLCWAWSQSWGTWGLCTGLNAVELTGGSPRPDSLQGYGRLCLLPVHKGFIL